MTRVLLAGASVFAAMTLAACGGGQDSESGSVAGGPTGDTGATITMWTRAATQAQSERLVEAYNAKHKNQVKLTVIPTDNYQPRIAAASGAASCPTCSRPM